MSLNTAFDSGIAQARSDPSKTTQPIALFELGQALGEGRRIVVGADPGYPRERDVHLLCRINRPGMPVWSTLDDTLTTAIEAAHG